MTKEQKQACLAVMSRALDTIIAQQIISDSMNMTEPTEGGLKPCPLGQAMINVMNLIGTLETKDEEAPQEPTIVLTDEMD